MYILLYFDNCNKMLKNPNSQDCIELKLKLALHVSRSIFSKRRSNKLCTYHDGNIFMVNFITADSSF